MSRTTRVGPAPGAGAGRGFTLLELALVVAVLSLLLALVWPVLASARKASARTTCSSNLRQIGIAYQMYLQDHGHYPAVRDVTVGKALADKSLLVCPQDREMVLGGATSSYHFALWIPPSFEVISEVTSVDPNIVLTSCGHHTGQKTLARKDDSTYQTPGDYPFRLVVRASGAVQRIHLDEVRALPVTPEPGTFQMSFPGEPGYETALEK